MYKIVKNKKGKFELIELATEQIIDVYDEYSLAKKEYNRFKGGQGFSGWTPAFVLISMKNLSPNV